MGKSEAQYEVGDKVRVNAKCSSPRVVGQEGVITVIEHSGLFKKTDLHTIYFGEWVPGTPAKTVSIVLKADCFDKI
jgi:hypothetical protein